MKLVTRKSELKVLLDHSLKAYETGGLPACVEALEAQVLSKKVKFPLLEFCGQLLFQQVDQEEHMALCHQIEALKTEGGNVILGIILQLRLPLHFDASLKQATEIISRANVWYICDIIGERVYGYALLHRPDDTIPFLRKLVDHPSQWVVRALGAGVHYAIKKGLSKKKVALIFPLLLSKSQATNKEIRQGIGWAAKTTAKFHPDLIERYEREIANQEKVANWFRRKIVIGRNRNDYAKGNSS